MDGNQTTLQPPAPEHKPKNTKASLDNPKNFAFDRSYWSFDRSDPHFADQSNVFEDLGKPLIDNAFQGYNNCIFAYGQTGSGKSYSMMGFGAESGVIPRICKDMFDRIEDLQKDPNVTCAVEVSYLEIYNERVRDLLNPSTRGNLKVREHPSTGPYVEDLAKLLVRSFPEIENLMDEGNKARTVAATNMNETSSRSHAVFTLTLTQKKRDEETKMDMERSAKISLVDLAGSERANSTGATGARLKEGAEINRSLSTLGRVIAALADLSAGKKKNASMIPYRDSVLTWLLKDSLGGNSMTAMIAAISPADLNFEETLSTLRYADSAKRIKNHAVVNEDANARMIRELKEELAQLRSKLGAGREAPLPGVDPASGAGAEGSQYPPDTPLEKQMVTFTQPDGTAKQVSKAEIAEQLSQSEKLYTDLNQTWEQKLQKTEEIHKEREAALEDLGISIEKGFVGVSTPKKMPHLVNLSDDPLLAECLVYNLKPGDTTVGNDDMSTSAEIRLKGSKILKEHCIFENADGIVRVVPNDDAAVMVNGLRCDQPKRLHSGFRVILGDFHIFRFNHPQEARAERAEQQGSMLRNSITSEELSAPADHARQDEFSGHESRRNSDAGSDTGKSRGMSPASQIPDEHDYDWSSARREAAAAILGPDQKLSHLTDEELDVLLDGVQKIRHNRRNPNETRMLDQEDDVDSNTSIPTTRDKNTSANTSTADAFSLDTTLTAPSTPNQGDDSDRPKVRDDLQRQYEKQTDEYQNALRSIGESHAEVEEARAGRASVEQSMQELRLEMEQQLQRQRDEYERRLEQLQSSAPAVSQSHETSLREKTLARFALGKWRQRKYVHMAEQMFRHASQLKEAQILSHQMGKPVMFQFAVVDVGQLQGSSYDLVLNGVSDEDDDDELHVCSKPAIGVRLTEFKHHIVYLWSLSKLDKRLHLMRQMQQYLDRPEYMQHFKLDNPFSEACLPQFTRIGEARVSLAAVFESRVQDFVADVISPYTFSVVGILRLSLEPSLAEAPASTMKFNVVLRDMSGFSEIEGRDVHAQLSLSGSSEDDGVTTTQLISNFNEGPLRFDSIHGMSLSSSSSRDSNLTVSIFAKVTSMHLDKLLSWDDMQDAQQRPENSSRVSESEFRGEEKHDVFARMELLELSENGQYELVEVHQTSPQAKGAFQLHQGLQRRIVVNLSHACTQSIPWKEASGLRVGNINLLDSAGQVLELCAPQQDILLKLTSTPSITNHVDGTSDVVLCGQWDSSIHGSLLLDRTTADKYRVQMSLSWDIISHKLKDALTFTTEISMQIRPRAFIRTPSMLSSWWNNTRATHSVTSMFVIKVKPPPAESALDLWRMNTQYEYVKGEEQLHGWSPRGVSLVRDYIDMKQRQGKAADVESTRSVFGNEGLAIRGVGEPAKSDSPDSRQKELLEKFLQAWKTRSADPGATILKPSNTRPPVNGTVSKTTSNNPATLTATVRQQTKSSYLIKSGYLLMPDSSQTRWIRRYLELRRPYLHVHALPNGDEINAINLDGSRIDVQPQMVNLFQQSFSATAQLKVFAIYAKQNAFLLATRSERERMEWVDRLDESNVYNGRK